MPTPLGKLLRSIGRNLAQDKRTCRERIAALKRSTGDNQVTTFVESLEKNSDFSGKGQPVPNAVAQTSQKNRASGSRGDDRIVYQPSERESIAVTNGPRGYSFRCVGNRDARSRQEAAACLKSGAGGINYTAVAGKTPDLGEIKRSGDNPYYTFVKLRTHPPEMEIAHAGEWPQSAPRGAAAGKRAVACSSTVL
jgi:hypothetical protein